MAANPELEARAKVFAKHIQAALRELGFIDPEVGILELEEFPDGEQEPLPDRPAIRIDLRHWQKGRHAALS